MTALASPDFWTFVFTIALRTSAFARFVLGSLLSIVSMGSLQIVKSVVAYE